MGSLGPRCLGIGGHGWLIKNKPLPHVCYHTHFGRSSLKSVIIDRELQKLGSAGAPPLKTSPLLNFGSSASTGVRINIRKTPNWAVLGLAPLAWACGWLPKNKHIYYHVKFGSSASKGVCINRREPPKLGSSGALPLCSGGVADP